jgi:hypothetical protein
MVRLRRITQSLIPHRFYCIKVHHASRRTSVIIQRWQSVSISAREPVRYPNSFIAFCELHSSSLDVSQAFSGDKCGVRHSFANFFLGRPHPPEYTQSHTASWHQQGQYSQWGQKVVILQPRSRRSNLDLQALVLVPVLG